MKNLDRYGSDLQTFFSLRKIIASTHTLDQYLNTLVDDSSMNRVSISCTIDEKISGFIADVSSLATIQVQKIPSQFNLERLKDKQA